VAARDGSGAAHPFEDLGFQDPQQFGLEFGFQVPDFVQEQGAAPGQFKAAGFVGHRTGERAFDVAEEFGFYEGLHQGGAAEGHKGPLGPAALEVDGLGEEVLAGPGLTLQENRGFRRSHVRQHREEPLHGRALADDLHLAGGGRGLGSFDECQPQGLESFHPADNGAPLIFDGRRAHQEVQALPCLGQNRYPLVLTGGAVLQGGPQETSPLAAVGLKDLPAEAAHCLFRGKAGDLLGLPVEGHDPLALVDHEHPPVQVFQHCLRRHPRAGGVVVQSQHHPGDLLVGAVERSYRVFQGERLAFWQGKPGQEVGAGGAGREGFRKSQLGWFKMVRGKNRGQGHNPARLQPPPEQPLGLQSGRQDHPLGREDEDPVPFRQVAEIRGPGTQ